MRFGGDHEVWFRSLTEARKRVRQASLVEVGWILVNKTLEVVLIFACLRILARHLGPEKFGEYNLALTVNVLLAAIAMVPVQQAYLRYFHQAKERRESWLVTRRVIMWYAIVSLTVVILGVLVSRPLGRALAIEPWTCLAAGLAFFSDRWRLLGIQILNIQRRRTAWAVQHLAFLVSQLALLVIVLRFWSASVSAALLAYAAASLLLATGSIFSFRRLREEAPVVGQGSATGLAGAVRSFGLPYGFVVLLQWVQGFSDRYLLGAFLDLDAVGVYVAAYQVCGVPFRLASGIIHTFLVPVAYGGAKNDDDPTAIRRVHGIVVSGVALYTAAGLIAVAGLATFGARLLALVADARFALPAGVLVLLAVGRFLEGLTPLLQVFFEIRREMRRLSVIRLVSAVAMVVFCLGLIRSYGVFGAALGNLAAMAGYVAMMLLGLRERQPREDPRRVADPVPVHVEA